MTYNGLYFIKPNQLLFTCGWEWAKKRWTHAICKGIIVKWMQTALLRIWIWVFESISYVDNYYTKLLRRCQFNLIGQKLYGSYIQCYNDINPWLVSLCFFFFFCFFLLHPDWKHEQFREMNRFYILIPAYKQREEIVRWKQSLRIKYLSLFSCISNLP